MQAPLPGTYAHARLDLEIEEALGLPQIEINDYFQEIDRKRKYIGGFAEVYKAKCTKVPPGWDVEAGNVYAVKLFSPPDGYVGQVPRWKYIASEILVNKHVLPKTTVPAPRFRGAALWAKRQRPWAVQVSDWVEGANLREWLVMKHRSDEKIPESLARSILAGILEALVALHAASLAHRDVKPENVMLEATDDPSNPYKVWLVDFTLCKYYGDDSRLAAFFATPKEDAAGSDLPAGADQGVALPSAPKSVRPQQQHRHSSYPYVEQQPIHTVREKVPMLDIFAVGLIAMALHNPAALPAPGATGPLKLDVLLQNSAGLGPDLVDFVRTLLGQKVSAAEALRRLRTLAVSHTELAPLNEAQLDLIDQGLRCERTLGPMDQPDTQIIEEDHIK